MKECIICNKAFDNVYIIKQEECEFIYCKSCITGLLLALIESLIYKSPDGVEIDMTHCDICNEIISGNDIHICKTIDDENVAYCKYCIYAMMHQLIGAMYTNENSK